MARRRSISVEVSRDQALDSVSEGAEILFLRGIPHADDFGRLDGDPYRLRACILPGRDYTTERVEGMRDELVKVGLWFTWTVDGVTVVSYRPTAWDRHQDGLRDRTRSKYPDPPENHPAHSQSFKGFPKRKQKIPEMEGNPRGAAGIPRLPRESQGIPGKPKEAQGIPARTGTGTGTGSKEFPSGSGAFAPRPELGDFMGDFRENFIARTKSPPAKAGMEALGKAVKKWAAAGWTSEDCLVASGWFFGDGRKDFDPLHFIKAFDNGYAARLKKARDETTQADAYNIERDLETIERARKEWNHSREQVGGEPDKYLKLRVMGILRTKSPNPPQVQSALRDLAGFLGAEAPC
jgi:hypothetical protein